MFQATYRVSVCAVALVSALAWFGFTTRADERNDQTDRGARKVFIVAMENHNWTQPTTTTNPQAIFQNPAAPFVNGLVSGTSGISDQVAFATHYINAGVGVHPSEPNYILGGSGSELRRGQRRQPLPLRLFA